MSLTDWVILDVGGRIISTYRSTLVSSPNSVLAKMFSPHSTLEPAKTHNGHYSIDSDPDIFNVILNWLRYQKVLLPTTLTSQSVSVVAEYFGLHDLVDQLAPSPPNTWPEVVTLDVRGRKINVNRSFLTRYPNSYLAEMFSAAARYTPTRLSDGSYSLDADPECFMVIINFLQYDKIILPYFGGPTIEDIRFVANQFALGNEIMLALGQVTNRVAETKVRVVNCDDKGLVGGTEN